MASSKETFIQACAILGAVFWSVQLLPQIWLNYRRAHTTGLHQGMMILWATAGLPLGIHNILSHQHIALQVQAQILTCLSLVTWSQVMFYSHHWSLRRSVGVLVALMLGFGAVEAAFVLGFKYGTASGEAPHAVIVATAVLSAVGLSLGVLRHYYDIYSEGSVRGLSWGFISLDAAGDLTSLLAVVIRSPPDRLAAGIYASELGLWMGIMAAGLVFNVLRVPMPGQASTAPHEEPTPQIDGESISSSTTAHSAHSAFSVVRRNIRDTPQTLMQRLQRRA